jgi:hypothetical protein
MIIEQSIFFDDDCDPYLVVDEEEISALAPELAAALTCGYAVLRMPTGDYWIQIADEVLGGSLVEDVNIEEEPTARGRVGAAWAFSSKQPNGVQEQLDEVLRHAAA